MAQQTPEPPPAPAASSALRLADLPLSERERERAALIDFTVDRDDPAPLSTQLGWKLRAMIARGALEAGDRLPSVRELAEFAGVNVNTARALYAVMEDEGLIASEHGRGTFVTGPGELREAGRLAEAALEAAREAGVEPANVAGVLAAIASEGAGNVHVAPSSPLPSPDRTLSAAEQRAILREQISRLEAELAEHAWHDRRGPPPKRPVGGGPVGRVASVDELERTRAELIERLQRLREEASRRGAGQQQARAHVERMLTDPDGHRWEIVSSEELGEPSCKSWRVVPRFGPLGAVMGWWRVKVSSGCPLAGPREAR